MATCHSFPFVVEEEIQEGKQRKNSYFISFHISFLIELYLNLFSNCLVDFIDELAIVCVIFSPKLPSLSESLCLDFDGLWGHSL